MLSTAQLPSENDWACYVALWGHAIGMAQKGGRYFLMDPNTGLLEYASQNEMLTARQAGAQKQRTAKQKSPSDDIELQFFG